MRPATHVLISGELVRGTRAPDRQPTYGIRDDCTIATGTCDCPPCTQAATDQASPLDLTDGEWVTGPHGIKTWRKK